jgi:outer membrane protein
MKKISVILFVALFLAVVALFILHFTSNNKKNGDIVADTPFAYKTSDRGIAYVNIDTIIFNFEMFYDRREELLGKQKKAESELNSKGSQYEKGAKDYQEKVNKGLITRATAAEMEQALLQQELINLRDQLQSDLLEEEQVMNRQIIDYITRFLEENHLEYNYQYILGKSFGSVVLYGDEALDITQRVLDGLNEKYKAEKK